MQQVPTSIPGLQLYEEFLSREEEAQLLNQVDSSPWLGDLRRRVQHYGYKYDYKARSIDSSMRLGDLPIWSLPVLSRLKAARIIPGPFDQLIVNEYEPGQGIAAHVDCEPCFQDGIVSVSLGSDVIMEFRKDGQKIEKVLKGRSVLVLTGESRYEWKHGIPARKSDVLNGERVPRKRRVSLTFRQVVI